MASYLQIENISKSYGPKILFEHIGFNVNEGDKIALIAPNGTGKTSLLRILAGKDSSDSGGRVMFLKDIRIAFLEQDYDWSPELGILDQVLAHSSRETAAFHEDEKQAFVQRLKELLTSFRLPDFDKKMGELSGGEVKRVAISEMLALNADFLIMDEPTNHLDIEAIEFLESWLKRSRCTLLMVTHDRYFLDRAPSTATGATTRTTSKSARNAYPPGTPRPTRCATCSAGSSNGYMRPRAPVRERPSTGSTPSVNSPKGPDSSATTARFRSMA